MKSPKLTKEQEIALIKCSLRGVIFIAPSNMLNRQLDLEIGSNTLHAVLTANGNGICSVVMAEPRSKVITVCCE